MQRMRDRPAGKGRNMMLPASMTYVDAPQPGGPEVLRLGSGPVSEPKGEEVLIRVLAAGVNRVDVQQRRGGYLPPPGASPILGLEVAGEIVALGDGVAGWRIGDRVCALINSGGYAEYCAAPAAQCLPWPKGYDAIKAAALPETYFTVWANLFAKETLRPGESLLIQGGSSGIGVTAIQLARERGARAVYATAASAAKCEACRKLGAEAAINYREEDFVDRIRDLTGGMGVDVVLDMVGAPYVARNLRCLAMGGRLVMIGFLEGSKTDAFDFARLMIRHLTITGSTMRPRSVAQKGAIADDLRREVWPVLEQGRCGPVIDSVFPLARAAEAHALMESSRHIGKIMLTLD
jgi:NADPH2:quinone reductase